MREQARREIETLREGATPHAPAREEHEPAGTQSRGGRR
jgi:hypothetical protein